MHGLHDSSPPPLLALCWYVLGGHLLHCKWEQGVEWTLRAISLQALLTVGGS